jgi:hypothetical protein
MAKEIRGRDRQPLPSGTGGFAFRAEPRPRNDSRLRSTVCQKNSHKCEVKILRLEIQASNQEDLKLLLVKTVGQLRNPQNQKQ